jgi:hypothetical protein
MAFFVGTALIIAGQSLYRYATQTMSDLEATLGQYNPSQNEYYAVEGTLKWWRTAIVSTYGPISIYLITAGIATLALLTAYTALTLRNKKQHPSTTGTATR